MPYKFNISVIFVSFFFFSNFGILILLKKKICPCVKLKEIGDIFKVINIWPCEHRAKECYPKCATHNTPLENYPATLFFPLYPPPFKAQRKQLHINMSEAKNAILFT